MSFNAGHYASFMYMLKRHLFSGKAPQVVALQAPVIDLLLCGFETKLMAFFTHQMQEPDPQDSSDHCVWLNIIFSFPQGKLSMSFSFYNHECSFSTYST